MSYGAMYTQNVHLAPLFRGVVRCPAGARSAKDQKQRRADSKATGQDVQMVQEVKKVQSNGFKKSSLREMVLAD